MNINVNSLSPTIQSSHDGSGPTTVGKVYAVIITIIELAKALFQRLICTQRNDFSTPGKQFNSSALTQSLSACTEKNDDASLIEQYYAGSSSTITHQTDLDNMKTRLEMGVMTIPPGQALIIPLVFSNGGLIERKHSTLILVHNNRVEYYDPKGTFSKHFSLAGNKTLRDFLEHIRATCTDGGKIFENRRTHQHDCFNCGAYVSLIAYKRLVKNQTFEEIEQSPISFREVQDYRIKFSKGTA